MPGMARLVQKRGTPMPPFPAAEMCACVDAQLCCHKMEKPGLQGVQVLVGLATASSSAGTAAAFRQAVPQSTVVGIFRDLRGIAMATNSRRTYGK